MKKIHVSNKVAELFSLLQKKGNETSRVRNAMRNAHIRYIRKQPMKLLDESTGLMQCKICGATHFGQIGRTHINKLGDRSTKYKYGAWQCQNGCKVKI